MCGLQGQPTPAPGDQGEVPAGKEAEMSDEPTVCGWQDCQNILSPSGPSLYFCSQDHQRQWYLDRARAADRYGETIVTGRSEEHTSELQSRENLVCRLLLEKKKK